MVCQGGTAPTPSPPGTAQRVFRLGLRRHPVDYWGAVCASPEMETHAGEKWGESFG